MAELLRPVVGYPITRAARQAHRDEIRRRALAAAERYAAQAGRSTTCATGVRHDTCVGAALCICECHDPATSNTATNTSREGESHGG